MPRSSCHLGPDPWPSAHFLLYQGLERGGGGKRDIQAIAFSRRLGVIFGSAGKEAFALPNPRAFNILSIKYKGDPLAPE